MNKILIAIFSFILSISLFASVALAAGLSVRIEQPKTPSNDNSFKINFVTLDTQGRPVTVKCFKKAPADGDFSQFGSDINLAAGGSSGDCEVNSSLMSSQGIYQFFVRAEAAPDTEVSQAVTVDYKTEAPGTPYNYSKEEVGDCEYKIKFKTAADSGKTQKVEIYMSTLSSFPADSGTKVGEVGIGSDQEGSFNKVVSECDKTYYFAIRAFDNAGNGSGVVGDSNITIITKEVTVTPTATTTGGAIPVQSSQVGAGSQILGVSEAEATKGAEQGATGSAQPGVTPEGEVQGAETDGGIFSLRNLLIAFAAIIIIGGVYLYQKSKK